jgi:hypothetical protein
MFHEVGMARLTLLPFLIKNKLYRRSFTLSLFLVILIAWLQVQASHNKVWPDSVAILPSGAIDNNKIHIRNIRDFIYKTETDYQINYINKTYKALLNFKWVSN